MAQAESLINYRFKSMAVTEPFRFVGSSVSVRQLKAYINEKHKMDQKSSRPDKSQAPSELVLQDEASSATYTSEDAEIPKDTTVVVIRQLIGGETDEPVAAEEQVVAPASMGKVELKESKPESPKSIPTPDRTAANPEAHSSYGHAYNSYDSSGLTLVGLNDPAYIELKFPARIKEGTDISELDDLTEAQKIQAMMYQCLLFYDHTVYTRPAQARNRGPPPAAYACNRCGLQGHWSNACTVNQDQNNSRPRNNMRQPVVTATNATVNPAPYATVPVAQENAEVPFDLQCPLCQGILREAVNVPCCGVAFCDSCISDVLIKQDGTCPECRETISPDACSPNTYLRDGARKWSRDMQHVKRKNKDDSVASKPAPKPQPAREPATPPSSGNSNPSQPRLQTRPYQRPEPAVPKAPVADSVDNKTTTGEARTISSVISTGNNKISAAMLQQQAQPEAARRMSNVGVGATNNSAPGFMAGGAGVRMRPPFPAANMGAGFYPQQQFEMAQQMNFFSQLRNQNPAVAAAYGAMQMQRFGFIRPEMYGAMRFPQAARILPAGQSLRISRIPNESKVPVQGPDDSERRSPERSRDDYRDDRRRDKSPDRKYDKYDDRRDRRSDDRKRDERDDRRSPERRRSKDSERRARAESSDRRDRKKDKDSIKPDRSPADHRSDRDPKRDRKREESPTRKARAERKSGSSSVVKTKSELEESTAGEKEGPEKVVVVEAKVAVAATPEVEREKEKKPAVEPPVVEQKKPQEDAAPQSDMSKELLSRTEPVSDKEFPLLAAKGREEKVPVSPPKTTPDRPQKRVSVNLDMKKMIAAHVKVDPKRSEREKEKVKDRLKEKESKEKKPRSERTPIMPPVAVLATSPTKSISAARTEEEFPLRRKSLEDDGKERRSTKSSSKKDRKPRGEKRPRDESDDRRSAKKRVSSNAEDPPEGRPVFAGENVAEKEVAAVSKPDELSVEPKERRRSHKSKRSKDDGKEKSKRVRSDSEERRESKRVSDAGDERKREKEKRADEGGTGEKSRSHRSSKSKKETRGRKEKSSKEKKIDDSKSNRPKEFDARSVLAAKAALIDGRVPEKESTLPDVSQERSSKRDSHRDVEKFDEVKDEKRPHKSKSSRREKDRSKEKEKSSREKRVRGDSADRKRRKKKHREHRDHRNGADSANSNEESKSAAPDATNPVSPDAV